MKKNERELLLAAVAALRYMESRECHHEETHRAGTLWTICDGCGRKWSDDRDPFRPYTEPKVISRLRDAIDIISRLENDRETSL